MISLRKKIIIAVDGYSSCGKSSYAKLIAHELSYLYLDSGAMYRAVALFALRLNWISGQNMQVSEIIAHLNDIHIAFKTIKGENHTFLNGKDIEKEIRGPEVSSIVSEISKIPEVRERLVKVQKQMGHEKGIVMDGRDIGTVVFPAADLKIFMKADVEVRAKRRFDELKQKGIEASLAEIRENINERDFQDIHRKVSPLVQADDTIILDNSYMSFEEQMDWFKKILVQKELLAE